MPTAPEPLRSEWTHEDALECIRPNFYVSAGVIMPRASTYSPDEREGRAIDYLFLEWDYGYESRPCELD